MQQFSSSYKYWGIFFLAAVITALTACGGGNNSSGGGSKTPASIVISPSPSTSLNFGDVRAVTAVVNDSSGNAISNPTITWSSSNTGIATVSATGGQCGDTLNSSNTTCVCAGQWDARIIVCDTSSVGTGTATLTAKSGDVTSSITLFVHPRVARVVVTAPAQTGGCTSAGGTLQVSAQAFDANNNPVAVGPDQTAFTWGSSDSSVVSSSTSGLLTASNPGIASISASTSNVTSTPVAFNTCAVRSISAHLTNSTNTSFTADTGASQALSADVVDTQGKTISLAAGKLVWSASNISIASVNSTGTVSTTKPGSSAMIATCRPPTCNNGYNTTIFSNPVLANVNGTSSPTLIVASTTSTSLFPIDSSGTVGTAITLPSLPNSIVYANTGLGAYIGTDTSLLAYDATQNAIGSVSATPGIVIGVSNDGGLIAVFDSTANTVTVVSNGGSGGVIVDKITVSGIPASCRTTGQCPKVSFSPDSKSAFIVAGNKLYVSSLNGTLRTFSLSQAANDVAVTNQGSFAFVADSTPTIEAWAACNLSQLNSNTVNIGAAAKRLVSSTNGTKIYAVTPPTMTTMTVSSDFVGCPPTLSNTVASVDLGQGTFNIRQIFAATRDNFVVMFTDSTKIVIYDVANNTGSSVALSGGANVLTGGVTTDGAFAYVGGSDNKVHKIDLTNKTDASQISVTVTPELVGVRPQ